jgi:hypothetical protein
VCVQHSGGLRPLDGHLRRRLNTNAPKRTGANVFAVTALLLSSLAAAQAEADEEARPPSCRGWHSLFDPLPDACLEVIDTDRPHQTDTPHVVPAGHTQVESALVSAELGGTLGAPPGDRSAHLLFFDNGYKFGLFSHVDFQLLIKHADYVPAASKFVPPGQLGVRAKWNFLEGGGKVPALTFVPWVFVPMAPGEPLRAGPLLFLGWELPAHFELEVNTGVLFSEKPKPAAAPVLASALTYTVVGEFRVFVDAYATGGDIALGTGALWAFARDMQVDLGTYIGLHGDEPVATPFLGFSIRR